MWTNSGQPITIYTWEIPLSISYKETEDTGVLDTSIPKIMNFLPLEAFSVNPVISCIYLFSNWLGGQSLSVCGCSHSGCRTFMLEINEIFSMHEEKFVSISTSMCAVLYFRLKFCSDQSFCRAAVGCALFSLTNSNLVHLELLIKLWQVGESRANRILLNDWLRHWC